MRFKEALKQMIVDEEFEKIIKTTKGKDRRQAKEFYEVIKNVNIDTIPGIAILCSIYSPTVLRDVIAYMEMDVKKD